MTAARVTPSTRVLLVRHGQSTWNADGRWQGQADAPLSALGEAQAKEAAARVGRVDAIWASDLVRASRTAGIVGEALSLDVQVDARLRERHAGPWQGLTRVEIEAQWPGDLAAGRRPDGFEPDASVLARALDALGDLAGHHPAASVLVVTHGGVVRVLERHLGGDGEGLLANLGGRRLLHRDGSWQLDGTVELLDPSSRTVPGQL